MTFIIAASRAFCPLNGESDPRCFRGCGPFSTAGRSFAPSSTAGTAPSFLAVGRGQSGGMIPIGAVRHSLRMSLRESLRATMEMALPTACGGCGSPGLTWCGSCRDETVHVAYPGGSRQVRPTPCPAGCPPTWAATSYDGVARAALVAFKDGDRRDLRTVLAPMLSGAMAAALVLDPRLAAALSLGSGPVAVVPVPSSPSAVRRGRATGAAHPGRRRAVCPIRGGADHLARAEASTPGGRSGRAQPPATSRQP